MTTVLVVDDDANVRLTLAMALRRFGHEVAVAPDAEAALELLHQRHFEWVVSDVRMPGMSGVEFATLLCSFCDAPRIVLTSAYSDITAPGGVVAFFQKPVDTRQLSEFLNRPPQMACHGRPIPGGKPPGGVEARGEIPSKELRSLLQNQDNVGVASFSWASCAEVNHPSKEGAAGFKERRVQHVSPLVERRRADFVL